MKIKSVIVNTRKKTIEIETPKGILGLPFAKLRVRPTTRNRLATIYVDPELGRSAVTYRLASGQEDSVHIDAFLDYNRDPEFLRKITVHKLSLEAANAMKASGLSKHEVVRRLKTSPSQLYRLLDPTNDRKSIDEMLRLLSVLGYTVEWSVVKQAA
jgi:antitoxin HicB